MSAADLRDKPPSLPASPRPLNCPHCGANCWDDDETCWHCHRRLDGPPVRPRFAQFSIGMILFLMTAIAVALATIRWFPLATVLLVLWIAPATLHAYLACRILRTRIPPVDFGERMYRFLLALICVLPALVVGLIAAIAPAALLAMTGLAPDPGLLRLSVQVSACMVGLPAASGIFWLTLPRLPKSSLDSAAPPSRQ